MKNRYKLLVDVENEKEFKKTLFQQNAQFIFNFISLFLFILTISIAFYLYFQPPKIIYNIKSIKEFFNSTIVQERNITNPKDFYFTERENIFLDCPGFWKGDKESIDKYVNFGRIKLEKMKLLDLPMDCDSVRFRIHGDVSKFDRLNRTIAFVRNIFKLYELQEAFLSIIYHPENIYCYGIDSKSDEELKRFMRNLPKCFNNIIVLQQEFNFDSAGHGQDRAHFACLETILNKKWDHAIILQNSDMIIKSPYQLSHLSEILNYTSIMGMDFGFKNRYNRSADWTPFGIKLFKNETGVSDKILHNKLRVRKGLNEVIVSKIFVKSIFEKLNLDNIINLFDNNTMYGVDEMLINTLYENNLGLDSQMESNCTKVHDDHLTRLTHWNFGGKDGYDKSCKSKWKRHGICILGVEYLQELKNNQMIIANKVQTNFDFGTVICMREMVRSMQNAPVPDLKFFEQFPQFREMQFKNLGKFNASNVDC